MSQHQRERNQAIEAAYRAGSTMHDLARQYGISRQRVQQILEVRQVSPRSVGPRRKLLDEDRMVALYETGGTLRDVAELCGCSSTTVAAVLERRGIARRPPGARTLIGRT